jgi:hypothetical protein
MDSNVVPNCQDITINSTEKKCIATQNFTWCPVFFESKWKLDTDNDGHSKGTCSR